MKTEEQNSAHGYTEGSELGTTSPLIQGEEEPLNSPSGQVKFAEWYDRFIGKPKDDIIFDYFRRYYINPLRAENERLKKERDTEKTSAIYWSKIGLEIKQIVDSDGFDEDRMELVRKVFEKYS